MSKTILVPIENIYKDYDLLKKHMSDLEKIKMPKYLTPDGMATEKYFDQICMDGLKTRFGEDVSKEVLARYQKEKNIIVKDGYVEYFLHHWDLVNRAKNNNITIGLGRGSACGSLICYILGITNINPLEHNLIFERFISSSEIIIKPDIELDFCSEDKYKITEYVTEKYGSDNIAVAPRYLSLNSVSDNEVYMKTSLFISDTPIQDNLILGKISNNLYVSLMNYAAFDDCSNCLKFTFNVLEILDNIKNFDIDSIPLDNKKVFELLRVLKSDDNCLFACPDENKWDLLRKINPENINELAAFYSLASPELLKDGKADMYINAKFSENKEYHHELLEPVLKESFGEIIYQEQIIQILNILGDFSLEKANLIRRLMYKNKIDMLTEYKQTFIKKACIKNMDKTKAEDLWNIMFANSKYCFLKAHAISFAIMGYMNLYIIINELVK